MSNIFGYRKQVNSSIDQLSLKPADIDVIGAINKAYDWEYNLYR
ncbi:MAG TPA: hypothetical protein VE933_04945 [Chitinophagaceae bacterium]|jgi:hypothetical protein|nr:hypothetical protein [Chitinophagaceae bacterium]